MSGKVITEKVKDKTGNTKIIKLKKNDETFMRLDKSKIKEALSKVNFFEKKK